VEVVKSAKLRISTGAAIIGFAATGALSMGGAGCANKDFNHPVAAAAKKWCEPRLADYGAATVDYDSTALSYNAYRLATSRISAAYVGSFCDGTSCGGGADTYVKTSRIFWGMGSGDDETGWGATTTLLGAAAAAAGNIAAGIERAGWLGLAMFSKAGPAATGALFSSLEWAATADPAAATPAAANDTYGYKSAISIEGNSDAYAFVDSATAWPKVLAYSGAWAGSVTASVGMQAKQLDFLYDGIGKTLVWRGDGLFTANQISVGYLYACSVGSGGLTKCWGENGKGQLGDGTIVDKARNTTVIGMTGGTKFVSAGYEHSCAVNTNGAAFCWGSDANGQLGNDNAVSADQTTPVNVYDLTSGIVAVETGRQHSCSLSTSGGMKCWGDDENGGANTGQLGNDAAFVDTYVPADVSGLTSGVSAIALGSYHSCALTTSGGVKCWGDDTSGQIGDDAASANQAVPADVSGLASGVTAIAAGAAHSCALLAAGTVKCWGENSDGQLGDNNSPNDSGVPVAVSGLSGVMAVTAGDNHTCALLFTGEVKCWGDNTSGQLGDNNSGTDSAVPVSISSVGNNVAGVEAGGSNTCVIHSTNAVSCWGDNTSGQVGDNTNTQRDFGVPVYGCLDADGNCAINATWSVDSYGTTDLSKISMLSAPLIDSSGAKYTAAGFSAAADASGNVVVVFVQKKNPAPVCSGTTTPATSGCEYRVFASMRGATGVWTGPTQLDGGILDETTSTVYQANATSGGVDYPTPSVAYLGDGIFMAAFPMINTSAHTGAVYVRTYNVGRGWDSKNTTLDSSGITGTADQYRVVNDLKLATDGAGNAVLALHRITTDNATVANRSYGHKVYLYKDGGWDGGTVLTGYTGCLTTACKNPKLQTGMFENGQILLIGPAAASASDANVRLFSFEYR